MLTVDVVVDKSTMDWKRSRITGSIHLKIGEQAFPEEKWNDNVALILSWWLISIRKKENDFLFMEGSFSFVANYSELKLLTNYIVQSKSKIVLDELHDRIILAAEQVLKYLQIQDCNHSDFEELKKAWDRLNE